MVTSPASFFMAASAAAAYDSSAISNSVWLDGSADHLTKSFSGSASSTEGVYSIWVQRTGYGTDDGIFATYGTIVVQQKNFYLPSEQTTNYKFTGFRAAAVQF